jgi:hypothetical protein
VVNTLSNQYTDMRSEVDVLSGTLLATNANIASIS